MSRAVAAIERGREPVVCDLIEWQCWYCQRVIAKYQPPVGTMIVRCKRCGNWNVLTTTDVE